jgi:hypothetical protein
MYRATKTFLAGNFGLFVLGVAAFAALWNLLLCSLPTGILLSGVAAWWTALCAISVVNVCGWRLSAAALARRKAAVEPVVYRLQRWQLLLSAVYVFGCGFRAILPRADVQRIGLYDSWASSVMVGRSVATVAELCFVAQWALLLNKMSRDAGSRFGVTVSWVLVPLIVVAELCSWYAVLTTAYIGNAVEESIWALTASLLIASCLALWSRCRPACRPFLAAAVAAGVAYVAFMSTVDVPMYVSRWLADEASGREYLSLGQGFQDVWCRRCVTFSWEEWRTEIPWMTLYFSVAVWCSIALVHAAGFAPKSKEGSEDGAAHGSGPQQLHPA